MKPKASPYVFPGLRDNYQIDPVGFICEWRKTTPDKLLQRNRHSSIKEARQIAMWLAITFEKQNTGKRHWTKVAKQHFPGYDHSTLVHSWKTVAEQYEYNRDFRMRLRAVSSKLAMEHKVVLNLEQETTW